MVFIWTEALGCAEVLKPSVDSFLKHHDADLNIFLYVDDEFINPNPDRVHVHRIPKGSSQGKLPSESQLKSAYSAGHSGTALLWMHLATWQETVDGMVHIDADTVFLRNVVDEIILALDQGYQVAGFRRAYFRTLAPISQLRRMTYRARKDKIHTMAFGFKPSELLKLDVDKRLRLISGASRYRFMGAFSPNLDFFDGAFDYLTRRISKVWFLGEGPAGGKVQRFGEPEPSELFHTSFLSFDAVGSGCVAFKAWVAGGKPNLENLRPYTLHGIQQWAIYSDSLLGREIGVAAHPSEVLRSQLERLDVEAWSLTK